MEKRKEVSWARYPSPLGAILAASDPVGITGITLGGETGAFLSGVRKTRGEPVERAAPFTGLFRMFDEYFRGRPVLFKVPLSLSGTGFDLAIWDILKRIPWGSARTYGEVARHAGRPGAARAVGGACGRNPAPIVIPCHRVLASGARLGGFSGGLEVKKALLKIEGVGFRGLPGAG